MTDDLVKRLLWHVEQTIGPVSDEPIVNEHDSDKAVLLFNFHAEIKRAIDYWYRQGRDDQHQTDADRIEQLTAEVERLREALTDIGVYGCGMLNQPTAMNGPEEAWLRLRIREMENVARAALGDTQ